MHKFHQIQPRTIASADFPPLLVALTVGHFLRNLIDFLFILFRFLIGKMFEIWKALCQLVGQVLIAANGNKLRVRSLPIIAESKFMCLFDGFVGCEDIP
jgi:uncharacterized membrane protein YqaE (UPF0057 family)